MQSERVNSEDENPAVVHSDVFDVRKSVRRSQRLSALRNSALVLPLIALLLFAFIVPILLFMYRSVDNGLLHRSFPRTNAALENWIAPADVPEEAHAALVADLKAIPGSSELAVVARSLAAVKGGRSAVLHARVTKL